MIVDEDDRARLREVWNQRSIPVVLRRGGRGERLRVRLPPRADNELWLQGERRTHVEWDLGRRCWEIPKAWFNDFVQAALLRYVQLYVVQPYREQEVCAPACWNAVGPECQCSCMGENHGASSDGRWFEVSETFATRWRERSLACRLMTRTH